MKIFLVLAHAAATFQIIVSTFIIVVAHDS